MNEERTIQVVRGGSMRQPVWLFLPGSILLARFLARSLILGLIGSKVAFAGGYKGKYRSEPFCKPEIPLPEF